MFYVIYVIVSGVFQECASEIPRRRKDVSVSQWHESRWLHWRAGTKWPSRLWWPRLVDFLFKNEVQSLAQSIMNLQRLILLKSWSLLLTSTRLHALCCILQKLILYTHYFNSVVAQYVQLHDQVWLKLIRSGKNFSEFFIK